MKSSMKIRTLPIAALLCLAAGPARAQPTITITRRGGAPPAASADAIAAASHMTGDVRVERLFDAAAPGRATGSDVTFEPGARTAWHSHRAGQTLIVTAGVGRVQLWGSTVEEIRAGDVVRIPPNAKHWHGAAPGESMTHLAISESIEGRTVDWMEPVTDAQYRAPARAHDSATGTTPASPAGRDAARTSVTPQAMNELTPRLAEITNRVLYGEVWADSALSAHDRSLATVSALITMNRPDQLRTHITRARANGVTRAEMAALITHLAF